MAEDLALGLLDHLTRDKPEEIHKKKQMDERDESRPPSREGAHGTSGDRLYHPDDYDYPERAHDEHPRDRSLSPDDYDVADRSHEHRRHHSHSTDDDYHDEYHEDAHEPHREHSYSPDEYDYSEHAREGSRDRAYDDDEHEYDERISERHPRDRHSSEEEYYEADAERYEVSPETERHAYEKLTQVDQGVIDLRGSANGDDRSRRYAEEPDMDYELTIRTRSTYGDPHPDDRE